MVDLQEIKQLSIPEQIFLVEEIWDNIARETSQQELPEWHRQELEIRWQNYLQHPEQTVSWEQIQTDLQQNLALSPNSANSLPTLSQVCSASVCFHTSKTSV